MCHKIWCDGKSWKILGTKQGLKLYTTPSPRGLQPDNTDRTQSSSIQYGQYSSLLQGGGAVGSAVHHESTYSTSMGAELARRGGLPRDSWGAQNEAEVRDGYGERAKCSALAEHGYRLGTSGLSPRRLRTGYAISSRYEVRSDAVRRGKQSKAKQSISPRLEPRARPRRSARQSAHSAAGHGTQRRSGSSGPRPAEHAVARALFRSPWKPKNFQNSSSHRILWHMYKTLNINENKN